MHCKYYKLKRVLWVYIKLFKPGEGNLKMHCVSEHGTFTLRACSQVQEKLIHQEFKLIHQGFKYVRDTSWKLDHKLSNLNLNWDVRIAGGYSGYFSVQASVIIYGIFVRSPASNPHIYNSKPITLCPDIFFIILS